MKKILILFTFLFFLTGCVNHTAPDAVKEYLEKFRNHDQEVVDSLDELIRNENLYQEEQQLYKLIMKKQYVSLGYRIVGETYQGSEADIEVELEVYDYIHSRKKALEYRENHKEEFINESGEFDVHKYKNLQLRYMNEETKRTKYTVTFHTILENDNWVMTSPDYTILQKIQGVYSIED